MPENKLNTNITLSNMIFGVIVTIITSVGGAYLSLREGDVNRETRLEILERNQVKLENKIEKLEGESTKNYQEIIKILGEIKAELRDKQNRTD
jgi:hypothetical protein